MDTGINEHWISVKEAAACRNVTERAIRLDVERGTLQYKYIPGKGRGGKQLRILLESLSQEAQRNYLKDKKKTAPRETEEVLLSKLSADKTDKLEEIILITQKYIEFRDNYPHKDHVKQFVKYMKKNYPMYEFKTERLAVWAAKYEEFGVSGLIDLRGCHKNIGTSLTKEMQDMFLRYYLTDKKPSIKQCYDAVSSNFNGNVPHISSFKRFLKKVPAQTIIQYRGGNKAFNDDCTPSIQTDYESVGSNFEWIADHHQYDVIVNDKGKIGRAWLSTWLDRRSRYIVGYVINLHEPNADIVLDSFTEAVRNCGIPRRIQIDNGKDYKVHDLFARDSPYALAAELKAVVRVSLPYNAKAKSIERAFRSIESFDKMLESYCGDRPDNRPESMKMTNDKIESQVITYEEFKKTAEYVINLYNNTPHSGKGMNGRTPYECYKAEFQEPMHRLGDTELLNIMRRRTRCIKVTKNGVKFAELGRIDYYSDDLVIHHFGERVYAKYFTKDVKSIHVYAENGAFIGVVPSKPLYVYNAGDEVNAQVIRENNKSKKKIREYARSFYPHGVSVPTIEEVYQRRSEAFGEPDFSDIPKVYHIDAEKRKEHEQIQMQEQTIDAAAKKKFVLPVEDDYDYELGLSRRYANGSD